MSQRWAAHLLIFGFAVGVACCGGMSSSWAQDGTGATSPAERSLAELIVDWGILEQQLMNKEAEFNGTDDFRLKEQLKTQYVDMVNRANELIEQLRSAALKALDSEADRAVAWRTLLGIMVNDANSGNDRKVLALGDELIARHIDPRYFSVAATLDRLSLKNREVFEELVIRQREALADDLPRVRLTTTQGEIVIELFENEAPLAVGNFVHLVENGMYDGVAFHRVIEGFMAQAGDLSTSGKTPLDYTIPCEANHPDARLHFTGSLSMALLGGPAGGKDTGNSQFFLVFNRSQDVQNLDRKHTVFGRVVSGLDVLDKLTRTHQMQFSSQSFQLEEVPIPNVTPDRIVKAEMIRKRDHEYKPTKVGENAADKGSAPPIEPPRSSEPTEGKSDGQSDDGD